MKVFIVLAVSIASMAGSGYAAQATADKKKTVDKRSPWQFGSYYSGFGDSLARSDDVHAHGAGALSEQQFGGGWHQEYQPQQQHWSQAGVSGHESKSLGHPVHEWQAERAPQVHFDEHAQQPQFHYGGSFQQPKVEQSFGWHHQNLHDEDTKDWASQHQQLQLHQAGGSSQEWHNDDSKEKDAGHGDWAPVSGGSSDLLKEHSAQSHTTEAKEHHHQEWAPIESKTEEHHDGHHHTKIIKVPYPVHIEKPYPVYIEKPFIVEKPVPLKLYIKKKHHH
ncbi:probable zinc transporter protein DDB_G0282067 [Anopheles marshallii]|uniref:probable zinc transporter protein DDB_G0282067 n=1 Tax=Anopheles marshallii TaxID=1521116 RepID=UPI00237BF03D|nr:probable zinc transporter protein DDB_G0282067 [Anopheles marshallii]